MEKGFTTLERMYGIRVERDGEVFNPMKGEYVPTFSIYTSDRCCWNKGLSRKGVKRECDEYGWYLRSIKKKVEKARRMV